jgi:MinD superfamily P-loop ATPase
MTELVVCSGKGGTGKTSIVASLAALAHQPVLADCDVDAANLHLVLTPTIERTTPFVAGHRAVIRAEDCTACGLCAELCRFEAIDRIEDPLRGAGYRVNPAGCEGCGVCVHFCPAGAIDFPPARCGEWYLSETRFGPLVHANLDVGAENSGKLVTLVRERARLTAAARGRDLILSDGPPGIGCPVTASLTGADHTLLVTEPSQSGLHDLERVLELVDHFGVPAQVCINKFDLSLPLSAAIDAWCAGRGIPVVGHIPFEPLTSEAQVAGCSLVEHAPDCEAAVAIRGVWREVSRRLSGVAADAGNRRFPSTPRAAGASRR